VWGKKAQQYQQPRTSVWGTGRFLHIKGTILNIPPHHFKKIPYNQRNKIFISIEIISLFILILQNKKRK
jgi:hypothetical protein